MREWRFYETWEEILAGPGIPKHVIDAFKRASRVLRPPPLRSPWQWAEAKRTLPKGVAEPGPYRSSRTPWVRDVTDAIAHPDARHVVFVCGSQMSKTDGVALNTIGWKMDDDPQPVIYFGPSEKNVKSISKDRLAVMIKGVPSLHEGLSKGKLDSLYEKYINGIRLGLGWGSSPTELASHPAALVIVDERDRMGVIKGEGDPVGLALARIATFSNGTLVVVSTPLLGHVDSELNEETGLEHWKVASPQDIQSPTWLLWQQGSRREWSWPCPRCERFFIPRRKVLKWLNNADPREALESAYVECPHCLGHIEETEKGMMNAAGAFASPGQQPQIGGGHDIEVPVQKVESFWASGLASPWVSFGERAFTEVTAIMSGDDAKVQTSRNTGFGEVHHIVGEAPDWQEVKNCGGGYLLGQVPVGVKVLYAAVDVQVNRLVYIVRGFADEMESWLIEHGEIWGDTDQPDVWAKLDGLLLKPFPGGWGISRMGIDSGYRTNEVYLYCRKHPRIAVPTKGQIALDPPYKAAQVEINQRGRVIKTGLRRWRIDATLGKAWVHSRIRWPEQSEGGWHVPDDVHTDYCQQVVAESQLPDGKWEVHGPNHYLDCEVIAYYMARIHGVRSGLTRVTSEDDEPREGSVHIPLPRPTVAVDPYLG